jgi:[ribosomal protein S5]-alanine N-acetyltransferase
VLPELITTERLVLRPPRRDDAAAIFDGYARDPEVTRFLLWEPHKSVATLEPFLVECIDAWHGGRRFPWVIVRRAENDLVGMIELRIDAHIADVGYVLARAYWGRGYASEALRAVIPAALSLPGVYRVAAACDVANQASARVMEKAGMSREGVLRRYSVHPNVSPEPRDVLMYSVVK